MPVAPSTYAMAQRQWPDLAAPMKKGSHHPRNRSNPGDISRAYLRQVSTGLSFTEDVVKERSYSSLPYDKKYLLEALDISHIVTPPSKSRRLLGRHNPSLSVKRHLSCNLKPLGKKVAIKAAKLHEDVVHRVASGRRKDEEEEEEISSVFLTDVDVDRGKKDEWDKHLVAILSQPTAEWIVHRHLTPGGWIVHRHVTPGGWIVHRHVTPGEWIIHRYVTPGEWIIHRHVTPGEWIVHRHVTPGEWIIHRLVTPGEWIVHRHVTPGEWIIHTHVTPGEWIIHRHVTPGEWIIHRLMTPGEWIVHRHVTPGEWIIHRLVRPGEWIVHRHVTPGEWIVHRHVTPGEWIVTQTCDTR